jgi:hypothetical protein
MGDIGLIVAAYAFVRCLEMLCKPRASFSSDSARVIVCVTALLVMLLSVASSIDLILSTGRTVTRSAYIPSGNQPQPKADVPPTPEESAKSRAAIQELLDRTH